MTRQPTARTLVRAGLAAALVALLVWLYAPTLKGLALEWASSPDSSYGAILVAMALAIIWSRRRAFLDATQQSSARYGGFLCTLVGLVAYLVGLFGADVFVTRVSFIIVAAGIVWYLAGNSATRVIAAPLAFLLLAVPLPTLVVNAITLPLQLLASQLAEGLLMLARVPVFRDGNVLELRSTSLQVAEACSGLRSAISLTALACLVAWATERSLGRRAALVAVAIPIAIVLNGLRVAATGIACELWGPDAASGSWHTFTGWITFVLALLALAQVQRLIARPRTTAPAIQIEAAT